MKQKLLKTMLLLCALVAGSMSVWAEVEEIDVLSESFTSNATTWTLSGTTSYQGSGDARMLQLASGNGAGSATTPAFSTLVGTTATLTFHLESSGTKTNTLTITGNNCKVDGKNSTTASATSSGDEITIEITEASTTSTVSFSAVKSGGCRLDNVRIYYINNTDPSSNATFANKTPSINFPGTVTFSQTATTASGYDNSLVVYSITSNTAGATIVGSTVTVTCEGSVTVKATAPTTTGFANSEDTYTLTVNDTRTVAGLSWSSESASVTYNDLPYSLPTLSNTHNLDVSYSSSDESVATIDNNGVLAIKNVTGTTVIRAEFDGNDEYKPQTVSYTLNVEKGPYEIIDGVFDFVEAGSSSPLIDYGSGESPTTNSSYYNTSETTWIAGNVTMVVSGKYRWWNNGKELRLYNTSPVSAATFSVPNGYVITKVVTTGGNFVSANVGTLSGDTWTGVAKEVKLSINTSTVNFKTITITYTNTFNKEISASTWATWVAPYNVEVPSGVSAYIVTSATTTATLEEVLGIPAGTPVLLNGDAGTKTFTICDAGDCDDVSGNLLEVSDAETTSGVYVLAERNSKVGFYIWDGGLLGAGRVMLPASAVSSVREFIGFDFAGETVIKSIDNEQLTIDNVVFDLSGRRVVKPTKGLYIVNGKKVVK